MNISNISRLKELRILNQQVKDLLNKGDVDLEKNFDIVIGVLQKPERNNNDLKLLYLALSSVKFFAELAIPQSEIFNLFKVVKYATIPARRTLFHYGDIGQNFYIILEGSVSVLTPKPNLQNIPHLKFNKLGVAQIEEGEVADEDQFSKLDELDFLEQKYPNFAKIGYINKGDSFGEIALTNSLPRQATIVCNTDCKLIKLSRQSFTQFLSEHYGKLQLQKIQMLKQINIFNQWNDTDLEMISYNLQQIDYPMNSFIFKEGEITKGVFFVISGVIELSIKEQKNIIIISRYQSGQLFGQIEVLQEKQNRISRALCISEKCTILFLPIDKFKIHCCTGDSLQILQQDLRKLEQIKQRNQNIYEKLKRKPLQRLKTEISIKFEHQIETISHREHKLQNYCHYIGQQNKISLEKLSFERPLIEIELCKRVKLLQQSDKIIPYQKQNRRLKNFLKLPEIQQNDDRITIKQIC